MKVATSDKPNNPQAKRVVPPIPYERPPKKDYAKGTYITLKLRSVPADENSATHDLIVSVSELPRNGYVGNVTSVEFSKDRM